ncbi:MAG: hypothetical protein OHK0028_23230 [Deltaproteobacteria bacterium]
MACRDIRESISAFVDGEASPEEASRVREHLAACDRCRLLERQMRAMGAGVRQIRGSVPAGFREAVFARLDAEGALPPRKKVRFPSWRRAAVPLAAAAALGLFLLTSREAVRGPAVQGPATARLGTSSPPAPAPSAAGTAVSSSAAPASGPVAIAPPPAPAASARGNAGVLTAEEREMVALLDILEDPASLDADGDAEGMDLLVPGGAAEPAGGSRAGRGGA